MAYTTVAKVQALFRDLEVEATDTVVTIPELNEFIARADALIDGKLAKFYTVPITGVESLLVVEEISTLLAAHRVKGILELTEQQSDVRQDVQGNLWNQGLKILKSITPIWDSKCCSYRDAEIELTDAVKSPTVSTPSKWDSQNKGIEHTPTFTKGGMNW